MNAAIESAAGTALSQSGSGRMYHYLMQTCGALAGLVIGVISVFIVYNVISRNVGLGSMAWIMEGSEYAIAAATYLGAPWVLYQAAHVRIDLLAAGLPPQPARWLNGTVDLLGALICGALLYFMARAGVEDYVRQTMVFKAFTFPVWWTYTIPVFCFALLSIEFLRRFWRCVVSRED